MNNFADLDLNAVWLESMGWNVPDKSGRKFDDEVEARFWDKLAPRYTDEYNLNHDTSLLALKLKELMGEGKTVLEIGAGSGNFTVLMAAYASEILAFDFSSAMLGELKKRLEREKITNVFTQQGKWEEYFPENKYDYIVSVNSLYRIRDIESALMKMYNVSKEGIIILRTIQRPYFYKLYQKLGIKYTECPDYELLPLFFWRKGIGADVTYVNYCKEKTYAAIKDACTEILGELGREVYAAHEADLKTLLGKEAIQSGSGYIFSQPRTSVFITVKK